MADSYLRRRLAAAAMLLSRWADVVFASRRPALVAGAICRRAIAAFLAMSCLAILQLSARANQFVVLDYNLTLNDRSRDRIFIEVFDDKPATSSNFMAYVNGGVYDGMIMHRLARNFVIQGGGFYPAVQVEPALPLTDNLSLNAAASVDLDGDYETENPNVVNEYSVGTIRSNLRGTIAMARVGGQPDSADSQWFINIGDNTGLDSVDGGFTVFAQVRGDGMTTLIDAFNSLNIFNMNPDTNDNGTRDGGPFYNYSAPAFTDGVPRLGSNPLTAVLVTLQKAQRIDYYGNSGSSTTLNFPAGGYTIADRDAFFDAGTTFTGTGGLTIGAGRTLGVREGTTLTRNVNNLGTLAPGLQNGVITVQSYQQGASGTLAIQIRGTTLDTHYDRLAVTGTAQLGGKLDVSLLNLFQPAAGQTYNVLTAGSITGSFATLDLPTINNGLVWNVTQSATAVTLLVVRADYNQNGVVDLADYTVWRDTLGTSVAVFTGADGDGNGTINNNDFSIWKAHFGKTSASTSGGGSAGLAAAGVPEPGPAALLVVATGTLAVSRRRRRLAR